MHYSLTDSAWPNLRGRDSMIAEHIMMTEIANEYEIEKEMLDLHPYIDREPCLVLAGSSIRAAHKMIRSGQETVYVCEKVDVVGTVKRRDILPGMLEIALHDKDELLAKGITKRKIHRHKPSNVSGDKSFFGDETSTANHVSFMNTDPDADSHHEISMFEPRFYQLFYDFLFRRGKHKLQEAERKTAYGGRTQLGRLGSFGTGNNISSKSNDRGSWYLYNSSRSSCNDDIGGPSNARRATLSSMMSFGGGSSSISAKSKSESILPSSKYENYDHMGNDEDADDEDYDRRQDEI